MLRPDPPVGGRSAHWTAATASRERRVAGVVEEVEEVARRSGAKFDVDDEVECRPPTLTSVARRVDEKANLLV
jgi:hypothetical protein